MAGLFFLRFWTLSRDRIFLYFCVAFWLLGLNWLGLALIPWVPETRDEVFVVRLLAFILIIVGVVEKNCRARNDATAARLRTRRGRHEHARPSRSSSRSRLVVPHSWLAAVGRLPGVDARVGP